MGTQVLRSQDCIREAPANFYHRRNYSGQIVNRKPVRPEYRRNSPAPKKSEVLGQVTILKRGESLGAKVKAGPGPDPKQVRFGLQDTYAGSAFSMSPAPSSLPFPTFCVKAVDDLAATRDLRRLLRLE